MKRSRIQAFLPLAFSFFILASPSYLHCSYFAEDNFFSTDLGLKDSHHAIEAVILAFASTAAQSKTAGFDAVQIHETHGYLLSQFLSPFFQQEKRQYGGSVENRAKLAVDVLKISPSIKIYREEDGLWTSI